MRTVKPKKNLGQHFLTDLNIAKAIADTVDSCPNIPVLEVGPGMGVLTQYLMPKSRELKVVEIDSESVAYLYEKYPELRQNIVGEDFLKMDLNNLFNGRQFVLTGNYPYDISSQIFFKMLDNTAKQRPVTSQIRYIIACHTYDGTFHFGWRIEHIFIYCEQIFNIIPCLYENTQYPIRL